MPPDFVQEWNGLWLLARDTHTPEIIDRGFLGQTWFADLPEVEALDAESVAVDVGAFIGDTCLPLTEMGATVFAYECQPDAIVCLNHNCPTAMIRPVAVGDGTPLFRHGGKAGNMGARWTKPGSGGIPVESITLDSENFRRVDVLKVDVEGVEPMVLRGAKKLLRECRPVLIVKNNERALARNGWRWIDVLRELPDGYEPRVVHSCETHADVVFTPKKI